MPEDLLVMFSAKIRRSDILFFREIGRDGHGMYGLHQLFSKFNQVFDREDRRRCSAEGTSRSLGLKNDERNKTFQKKRAKNWDQKLS